MRALRPPGRRARAVVRGALVVLGVTAAIGASVAAAELPVGNGRHDVELDGVRLAFLSYKPREHGGPLILSFHGSERNPAIARAALIPLADASRATIVAPEFDEQRFPRWAYQLAGIAERIESNGRARFVERPRERWTGNIVLDLVAHIRRDEGRPDMPFYLIGHSGGAQFLGRFAAFMPSEACRIVLANAGTYVFPEMNEPFPYGFGGLSEALRSKDQMRHYLASPITILLGTEDLQRWGLNTSRGAERQGLSRYERGAAAFGAARKLAAERGWSLNWSMVDVPDAGHSSAAMYGGPEARVALFGSAGPPLHATSDRQDGGLPSGDAEAGRPEVPSCKRSPAPRP